MNRSLIVCLAVGLVLLLAACQDPAPQLSFEGVSTVAGVEQPLQLTFVRHADRLSGEYHVGVASGTFNGSVDGDTVLAELKPSADCTYSFIGTLSDSSLQGSFEPNACPGGQFGNWSLVRK